MKKTGDRSELIELTTDNDTISPKLFPVCTKILTTLSDPTHKKEKILRLEQLKGSKYKFNSPNKRNIESIITFLIHKEMLHSENRVKGFFQSCYLFICKCDTKTKFSFSVHPLHCRILNLIPYL